MKKTVLVSLTVALVVFAFMAAARVLGIGLPVSVTTTAKSSELAVVGEGKVEVTPDVAFVDAGVNVNNASTVQEAQSTITKVNNGIVAAMQKLGIPKSDIKTSNYSVFPNYSYVNNVNRIDGYNGNATISIKAKDSSLAPRIIEEATKAGANQINGVRFTVEKPEKYREEARSKAIANAKEQAQKMAQSLGITLGKVVNVVETNPAGTALNFMKAESAMGMGGGGSPDLEAGSQTITSVVTLYFEKR